MMESWDREKPLYKVVAALATLRRENPAIALGSQTTRHVSVDAYVFTRRYREYRCWVAVNKAVTPVTLEKIGADLPDGSYDCVLTGARVEVEDGNVALLTLGAQTAVVLTHHSAQPLAGKAVIRVQVNGLATKPGQIVVVTGDCPELGSWDMARSYPLEYISSNCWFGEIAFNETAGRRVAYKYAIREKGADGVLFPTRENTICRRRIIPAEGHTKWRDHWSGRA